MRIVVLGAGGFVGGWICEEIAARGDTELVACVRKWEFGVRLGRRGIAICQADLEGAAGVDSIVAGADVVVNAALPPWEREGELAARLYASCAKTSVKRLIQFSSIAVYGSRTGEVSEEMAPTPDDEYGRGKVALETRLSREASSGGPTVIILRPSIIYGPFSDKWTVRYAQRIARSRWDTFGPAGLGTCNLVHGHDVARAVLAAATVGISAGFHVFNINGPDIVSWNEYFARFGDALDIADRFSPNPYLFYAMALSISPVRLAGRFALTRFNDLVVNVYRSGRSAREVMNGTESLLKLYPSFEELKLLKLKARYSWARAASALRFEPAISLEEGLRQSAQWCRTHGIV